MIKADANLDKRLRNAIKTCASAGESPSGTEREKANKNIAAILSSATDEEFRALVLELSNFFLTRNRMVEIGRPLAFPVESILHLGRYGFSETVAFVFDDSKEELRGLSSEQLLSGGIPEKVLKSAAKVRKDLLASAIEHFNKCPEAADLSPAADWMFSAAKPKQLITFLSLLFSKRERLPHLKTYPTLAQSVFQRDKAGAILKEALSGAGSEKLQIEPLERIICSNPDLTVQFTLMVPKLVPGPNSGSVMQVFNSVLQSLPRCPADSREQISVALAAVATQLLMLKKRKPEADQILEGIFQTMGDVLTAPEGSKKGFWVFCQAEQVKLEAEPTNQNAVISKRSAEFVVDALEESLVADSNQETLAALAFNLGLRPIGVAGEDIAFDPKCHEDTHGGLFRNDRAVVVKPGWDLSGSVIARAKVKGCDGR